MDALAGEVFETILSFPTQGIDFVNDPSPMADRNGHGTHVAGVFTLMPWTQLVPCSDVLVAMISLFYAYVHTVQVVTLRCEHID